MASHPTQQRAPKPNELFVEVPGSVVSPSAILLPIPDSFAPNNAKDPGKQPRVLRIVEVPGIEPGSAQIQSGLLRA